MPSGQIKMSSCSLRPKWDLMKEEWISFPIKLSHHKFYTYIPVQLSFLMEKNVLEGHESDKLFL